MNTQPSLQFPTPSRGRLAAASLLAGVLLMLGWILLAPVSATAAVWEDVTCSFNGHVASTEGWSQRFLETPSSGASATNSCSTPGGALTASDQSRGELQTGGSGAEWVYTAPKGEPIAGGAVTVAVYGGYGQAWLSMSEAVAGEGSTLLVSCFYSVSCKQEGEVPITKHGADQVYAGAVCVGNPETNECRQTGGLNAEVTVSSAKFLLSDNSRPTAAEVTGSILDAAASGTASLSFVARDSEGPGVYGVVAKVDGDPVYDGKPDVNGGKCVTVGTAPEGSRQFEATQPCPQSVLVSAQVPTSGFGNGQHTLTIEAEDAAGVSAVVYSAPITIENQSEPAPSTPPFERGPCNGTPCEDAAKLATTKGEAKSFTRTLGHSAITLTGRLISPTGTPIKDAQVKLLQQINGSTTVTQIASATTSADGSWSLKAPAGPSRLLRVAFYSHTLDVVAAATLDFHESVPATISIHAPRHVRLGQFFVFSGQLTGGYIPAGGEEVQVQIKYGGKWRELELVDADSRGKWKYRYAFTLEPGTKWAFRAIAVRNGAYPFASHGSHTIHVAVRR